MRRQINSRKIVFPQWKFGTAYVADRELLCAGFECGKIIEQGELYTRKKVEIVKITTNSSISVHPFCRKCITFVEADIAEIEMTLLAKYRLTKYGKIDTDLAAYNKSDSQTFYL
jgi:hypothetical protein